MRSMFHAFLGTTSAALLLLTGFSPPAEAATQVLPLHSYSTSDGREITQAIAVSTTTLLPFLPAGYQVVPASALGVGTPSQGVVAIANFQGFQPVIDQTLDGNADQVAIDVGILIDEPENAALANVNFPGAFHFYTLAIYTEDPQYADSLQGWMPVEFVKSITYVRQVDDATGFGTFAVSVPDRDSPFHSFSNAFGYQLQGGALDAVFWRQGKRGTSVLHFHDEPFLRGQALSQVYARSSSWLGSLLLGGGIGQCSSDTAGNACLQAPALNLRYPAGSRGQLSLVQTH